MKRVVVITLIITSIFIISGCTEEKKELKIPTNAQLNPQIKELKNPIGNLLSESYVNVADKINPEIKKQTDEFIEYFLNEMQNGDIKNIPIYKSKNSDDPSRKDILLGLMLQSENFKNIDPILIDEYYGESLDKITYTVESANDNNYTLELPIEGCRAYKIFKSKQDSETKILIFVLQYENGWKFKNLTCKKITIDGFDKNYWFEKGESLEKEGYIVPACIIYKAALYITQIPYYQYKDEKYLLKKETFIKTHKEECDAIISPIIDGKRFIIHKAMLNIGQPNGKNFYEISYTTNLSKNNFNKHNVEIEVSKLNKYLLENKLIFDIGKMYYHSIQSNNAFDKFDVSTITIELDS
ncbi:hypothetical protein [Inediibacterium massiliense]|uniref:hypothetical protein n=1 Tax=Inediibacterium massiliense TaxID=1658111 RepID=UPI0006B696FC|nr:hypothetical protein [Inediibacterium massiliense]